MSMEEFFDSLRETAAHFPGSIALASRSGYMTYEDLFGNVVSAADAARRNRIEAGELVVLAGANPDAQLIIALALIRIGCRVGYSRDITLYDVNNVGVDAVIADAPIPGVKHRTIVVGREWFKGAPAIERGLPPQSTDYAMIHSSSGSTGRPKLVSIPPRQHRTSIAITSAQLGERPRYLSAFGNRTDPTFCDSLAALKNGGMVVRASERHATALLDTIVLFRPSYVLMAPSALVEALRHLDEKPMAVAKVPLVRTAGAYCAPEIQNAAIERLADQFMSSYGSAEMGWIAWGYAGDVQKIERCVGRVVDGIEVAAFDGEVGMLPPGSEGEIRAKGPEEYAGTYLGGGSPQDEIFKDGWFVTGDIGTVDGDGNLVIRGRLSNVINIGGSKISPELMEEQILSFSQVRDVGVTGIDLPEGFQKVCAAIVTKSKLTIDDVNAHLRRREARWPVQAIKIVGAIPRTESGKVDRIALRRLWAD